MSNPLLNAPLLLERYQPESLIARGGSASVYRARDVLLGRDVAVKVFLGGSDREMTQASDELRLLAQLSHHGIVAVLDAGIDRSVVEDPRPFLVMELVRGDTVRRLIDDGPLPIEMVSGIAFEVAETLEYIHRRGVIHRDISPSNIVLADYGSRRTRPRARLTDFGIAVQSGWMPPHDGLPEGTAAYLSPEQVLRHRLTSAADIYSLGRVLLECFTRDTATPDDIPKTVPRAWRSLLESMTRREPSERPDAAAVLEDVRRLSRRAAR